MVKSLAFSAFETDHSEYVARGERSSAHANMTQKRFEDEKERLRSKLSKDRIAVCHSMTRRRGIAVLRKLNGHCVLQAEREELEREEWYRVQRLNAIAGHVHQRRSTAIKLMQALTD